MVAREEAAVLRFDYRADDGSVIEREFPVGKAPREITEDGKTYRQAIVMPDVMVRREVRFKCRTMPRWAPGADSYSPEGFPQFTSRESAIQAGHRNGCEYDEM